LHKRLPDAVISNLRQTALRTCQSILESVMKLQNVAHVTLTYIRANKIRLYQNLRLLSTPGLYVNVSNLHFFDEIDSTHNSNRIYLFEYELPSTAGVWLRPPSLIGSFTTVATAQPMIRSRCDFTSMTDLLFIDRPFCLWVSIVLYGARFDSIRYSFVLK